MEKKQEMNKTYGLNLFYSLLLASLTFVKMRNYIIKHPLIINMESAVDEK